VPSRQTSLLAVAGQISLRRPWDADDELVFGLDSSTAFHSANAGSFVTLRSHMAYTRCLSEIT